MAFLLVSVAVSFAGEPVPKGFSRPLEWRIGAQVTPAWVPATNDFLKGENQDGRRIGAGLSGGITYITFKPQANRLMKHLREDSKVFTAVNYDEAEEI